MATLSSSQYSPRFEQCEFLEIDDDELDTSSLHARIIESPTRELLLFDRLSWTTSASNSSIDAVTLLSDLSRLAPSVAKDFIPKDHAKSSFPFRLINDIDFKGEEESYIAMSYCWKKVTRDTPRTVITPVGDLPFGWTKEIEQFPLPTSAATFRAVLSERGVGEGLWFDQVCIDQESENEKAMTIGAMDTIYKNARMVVVALDDVVATPEEEEFLRYYVEQRGYSKGTLNEQFNTGMGPPFVYQPTALKSFLERIISSAWFESAWCAHEMRMAKGLVFLVPCHTHYEDEVHTVIRFTEAFFHHMVVQSSELHDSEPTYYANIRPLLDFFHRRATTTENSSLAVQRPNSPQTPCLESASFVSLISETFRKRARGNPRLPEYLRRWDANRDKMCISLNASGLPLALTPSNPFSRPSIEDECLRSLILVGLAAQDPVSLCTTGTPLQLHDGSVSWLCRPTPLDVNPTWPYPVGCMKKANTIIQASDGRAEYVQLDLVFLDLPHRSQPNSLFPSHVARARMFIDLCIQHQVQASGLWDFWQTPNYPRASSLQNTFIQTLACVFNCGSQWLLDVTSNLQQPHAPVMKPYAIDMLLNRHLIIQNYIHLAEAQTALSLLMNFISTLIASGIPWASGASERTHGPLIISAPTSSPYDATSIGGKAIIFAPFEHSRTLLVAVPDALKGAEYDSLARGWILTSMNPYTGCSKPVVSWTLQSKGVVFGDDAFNKGLAGSGEADVRNHRVYGPSTC